MNYFDGMEIEFRDFTSKDRPLISGWITESTFGNKTLENSFMRHFSDVVAHGKLILAVHNGIPVGFSGGLESGEDNYAYINLLYVTPTYRNNYLGRELLCLIEDFYRDQGKKTINVLPPLTEVTMGFLQGMGYSQTESQLSKSL